MKKWIPILGISAAMALPAATSQANDYDSVGQLTLSYSNGQTSTTGIENVNKVLKQVGVRVSQVDIPEKAKPIIKVAKNRAVNQAEADRLISLFSLNRKNLLKEIEKAGRKPEAHRGGFLSTSEVGVAPYPKVYDMKAMNTDVKHYLQEKFGKLHVNSADNGQGIDEVMTIISGGDWTWFFTLSNNVVGKLTLGYVPADGKAWRISYPGLGPHGGFLDAEYGLVVAYAHGPEHFVMRYEEPSVNGTDTLGSNPWIDFSGKTPKLLD